MKRALSGAVVAALSLLLADPEVPAYLVRRSDGGVEYTWNLDGTAANVVGGKVTFYIDQASVSSALGITGSEFAAACRASVRSWEDVAGSRIAFQEDASRTSTAKNASDKINRFGFSAGVLPPGAFAVAFSAAVNNRVTDVDLVFNTDLDGDSDTDQEWSVRTPGESGKADVQGVAAHEWGHGLGMDHAPLRAATMFWAASLGEISLRSLSPDDEAGARHAYPEAAAAGDYGTIRGDVDVAGTADDRGVQVTAVDFATGLPAASSFTAEDGTYEIQGLAPGAYRVVAAPIGTVRLEGGTYSTFWGSASTAFLPAVRGQDGAADGSTGIHLLSAGQTLTGVDLPVSTADPTGEPNGTQGQAHAMDLGDSIAGRATSLSDEDWFSFAATSGQKVSIFLHAQQIGSDLDARLVLRRPDGTQAASNIDIAGTFPDDYFGTGGTDFDTRILDVAVDETGTWAVQVVPETGVDPDFPEDSFYVLSILPGGGVPSAFTSVFAASPPVIAADGLSTTTLTFEPLSLTGSSSGAGLAVTMDLVADGDPDGTIQTTVTDNLDGTYSATLRAASAPGGDLVRALVDGSPVSTATAIYRGPAFLAESDFAAEPRRIRPDGASRSTVVLLPRDANGVEFGAGHAVTLTLGDADATLGATQDGGDGTYSAVLTAGTDRESLGVGAVVDGAGLGGTIPVGVGFPLDEVMDDAGADLDAMLLDAPPAKSVKKLQAAVAALDLAATFPLPAETGSAIKGVAKAVKQLEAAAKKGAATAPLSRELAEAARQSALDAIADAAPDADEAKEQSALAKAQASFDAGEALLDAGLYSKAAAKYGGVFKQTGLVQ